ncbi:MAG TPA: hypothetical protein DCS93_02635 [Microscillaceae bacterium]|nr:hypothetical protein [Microscillaceae bacterium]
MSLKKLFTTVIIVTIAVATFVGVIIFTQINQMRKDIEQIVNLEEPFEKTVLEIEIIAANIANSLLDYVDNHNYIQPENIAKFQQNFDKHIELYKKYAKSDQEKAYGKALVEEYQNFKKITRDAVKVSTKKHGKLFAVQTMVTVQDELIDDLFKKYIDKPTPDILNKLKVISDFYSLNEELLNAIESYVIIKDSVSAQKITNKKLKYLKFEDNYLKTRRPDKTWLAKMNENFTITVSLGNELMRLESVQYNRMQDFHKSLNKIDNLLDRKIQPLIRKKNQELLGEANRSGNVIINFMLISLVLIIVVFFVVSRVVRKTVLKPVLQLNKVAKQVASGKLKVDFDIQAKADNEIGDLTASFKTMTTGIERLVTKYRNLNKDLETKVEERTEELTDKNYKITSSINYAKRIQEAVLPPVAQITSKLPDAMVFFKPRDIVSGDFYWFAEVFPAGDSAKPEATKMVLAAVDCTGHGVPGAFMSMIGNAYLNQIVRLQQLTSPEKILTALHQSIRKDLKQQETLNRDGMDVALVVIDQEAKTLEFAGAKNPLIYIQDGEMIEIKGDKFPVGGYAHEEEQSFRKHVIDISKPTTFYIYSDGFQDQFGGKKFRKFMSRKFKNLLHEIHAKPMQEQSKVLEGRLLDWMQDHKQVDDILVLGVHLP